MKTNIAELRKANKISQEELARAVGVTRQTITSIEVGIAVYFGMAIEDIFIFEEE